MEKFYIFLDIDGVLNNYEWIKFVHYSNDKTKNKYLSPKNIEIFNNFLNVLTNKKLHPIIVVSSTWRSDLKKTILSLKKAGLNYNNQWHITNFKHNGIRGLQIKDFVLENNIQQNFVVIDDETSDIIGHIPNKHIIKTTGVFSLGLTQENIDNFTQKDLPKILHNQTTKTL